MKNVLIKINESELKNIIKEAVINIIEDLGGTSSFSVNSAAGSALDPTGQQKNNIDRNAFPVQRRKIYQPKDEKAGGDVTKQSSNVDMSPAMKRKNGKGGSISIPKHRV